jgi:hypothetical protein
MADFAGVVLEISQYTGAEAQVNASRCRNDVYLWGEGDLGLLLKTGW